MRRSRSAAFGPWALALVVLPHAALAQSENTTAIEVTCSVPGARVFVDGSPEGPKLGVPIEVEPGSHEITVEAEGHAVYKRWVVAEEGRTVSVKVDLLPLLSTLPVPATASESPSAGAELQVPSESSQAPAWYERWWVWGALGVLAVGGVAFAVAASSGDDFVPGGELGRTSTRDWMSP